MEPTTSYIQDLPALVSEVPEDSIISRTFHEDERLKMILFGFAPGQELSEHTASKPAMLHFLQGEADLQLGDQAQTAGAGTWVSMPANLPHSVHARSKVIMLLVLYQ